MPLQEFSTTPANLDATAIRDLKLKIAGSPLEPILAEFEKELERAGIRRLRPHYYLSNEWGVPFGTIALAMPFYLVRPELTQLQAERTGFVEGRGRSEVLRYLRHEMGHVVNYGYKLYEREEWVKHFGSVTRPYLEEYRPQPFSRRFVRHLPGWYAQKHPDEDWAETFAVWMTPGLDWHSDYDTWPGALAKLEYCDRTVADVANLEPLITATDLDEAVDQMAYTLEDHFKAAMAAGEELPAGLDGALRAIFEDLGRPEDGSGVARRPAATLIRSHESDLLANIYRWTGCFPERTRPLLRYLAHRAKELNQVYAEDREEHALVALTTLVTALAMNHVYRNTYLPA